MNLGLLQKQTPIFLLALILHLPLRRRCDVEIPKAVGRVGRQVLGLVLGACLHHFREGFLGENALLNHGLVKLGAFGAGVTGQRIALVLFANHLDKLFLWHEKSLAKLAHVGLRGLAQRHCAIEATLELALLVFNARQGQIHLFVLSRKRAIQCPPLLAPGAGWKKRLLGGLYRGCSSCSNSGLVGSLGAQGNVIGCRQPRPFLTVPGRGTGVLLTKLIVVTHEHLQLAFEYRVFLLQVLVGAAQHGHLGLHFLPLALFSVVHLVRLITRGNNHTDNVQLSEMVFAIESQYERIVQTGLLISAPQQFCN